MYYLALYFYLLFATTPSETNTLTINISNIENIQGNLKLGLFNSNEGFMERDRAFKTVSVKVKSNTEIVVIENLPSGNYAISMYHDENSDDECNRNFLGIPTEAYAFSNNFKPKFSAPSFEDCEFPLNSDQTLKIVLNN
ncbi:MAG: DUF2141 domain-containing protein [Aequorivita sp.]|nr:DUF2141 domain-containing protein [Aequorivita sp.]